MTTDCDYGASFAQVVRAMLELGSTAYEVTLAMCEATQSWEQITVVVEQVRLYLTRAYLAGRWRLGWLAWRLPDWLVRRVPTVWVTIWWERGERE